MVVDTHAHLSLRFWTKEERDKLLALVEKEKIRVILAGTNAGDSEENVGLAKKGSKYLLAAGGIHPQIANPKREWSDDEELKIIEKMAEDGGIVAIGECGLDYSPAPAEEADRSKEDQEKLFCRQIELAIKHKLPLIVHARKAIDETIAVIERYPKSRGVFHCYTGGKKRIQKIIDLKSEWYFGVDGNLTYDQGLVEVVKNIPKNRLLLETDSPFLAPVPFRGETNNPLKVKYVYEKVAEIWKMSFEETEKIVDENVFKLFWI